MICSMIRHIVLFLLSVSAFWGAKELATGDNDSFVRGDIVEESNKAEASRNPIFATPELIKEKTGDWTVDQNIRRLQRTRVSFCSPNRDGTFKTVERGFIAAFIFRLIFRQAEGSCEEKCPEICNHVECASDYNLLEDGSCECLQGDNVKDIECGGNAHCLEDTCICNSGFVGDPLVECSLSTSPPTLFPTTSSIPCDEGGNFCPGNLVCCTTNSQLSCLKTTECCPEGQTYSSVCGCLSENEVCCSDRQTYSSEEGCPCKIVGGTSCPVGYECQKSQFGLIGQCVKDFCSEADSCESGNGKCCSPGFNCCGNTCIPENDCCPSCDGITEKCCDGICISVDECCESEEGKKCLNGSCANDAVSGCCQENTCGDLCCSDRHVCNIDTNECVLEDCSLSSDPCCDASKCTGSAGIYGDPHIETFDGLGYDCQASGEFVLLRSTSLGFKVHGYFRTVTERGYEVSVLTGIAIQPSRADEIIQFAVYEREIRAWIGHNAFNVTSGYNSASIAVTKTRENQYRVLVHDASIIIDAETWKCGIVLNFRIRLQNFHVGNIVGLLGTPDGNRNNDWVQNFGSKYASEEICSNAQNCASYLATDYCMRNWCIQNHNSGSLFLRGNSDPIFNETGCRAPSFYQTTPDSATRKLLEDPLLNALCGDELACSLDGTLFGYAAAKATVLAQTRLLENATFVASPSRILLNDPTLITLTLNVKNHASLLNASAFVVYLVDEESGTVGNDPYTILLDNGQGAGEDTVSGDFIFSNAFEMTMTTPGKFYGFEAVPIINGALYSDAIIARGRMIRSYTDLAIGDCFDDIDELRGAVDLYLNDNGPDTNVAKQYGWPIGSWCVTKIVDMNNLFAGAATFNEPLESWDVSNVRNMASMFIGASSFNQPLSTWDVSKVTDMSSMFESASAFNGDISSWNTSSVTTMRRMFHIAVAFDGVINGFNTSKVVTMNRMFGTALNFNSDISSWDTSNVMDFNRMFDYATTFNNYIGAWNTSSATDMGYMFTGAEVFNVFIGAWDVSRVTNMVSMFESATNFNQILCDWGPLLQGGSVNVTDIFTASGCTTTLSPNLTETPPSPFCGEC